jgi:hypothetical protein
MDLKDAAGAPPRLSQVAWAESFNEMFAQVAGEFALAATQVRAQGTCCRC